MRVRQGPAASGREGGGREVNWGDIIPAFIAGFLAGGGSLLAVLLVLMREDD